MEFSAVCSARAMTASMRSCLVGRGVSPRFEVLELLRACWLLPLDEGGEMEGGWPFDFGGGVGKVW